jgi:hypothetical protein
MWTEIFKTFVTDRVALLVHIYLLGGAVFGTILVAAGIIWESGPLSVREIATRLVIWGVVVETLCSVTLFAFDEGVSVAQQSTIEAQNTEIISLQKRLAARTLSDEQLGAIAERIKSFSGQSFQVIAYWKNPESLAFANRIGDTLLKANWVIDQPRAFTSIIGVLTGVSIDIDADDSKEVKAAAEALLQSLKENDVFATLEDGFQRKPPSHKVSISVGIKQ